MQGGSLKWEFDSSKDNAPRGQSQGSGKHQSIPEERRKVRRNARDCPGRLQSYSMSRLWGKLPFSGQDENETKSLGLREHLPGDGSKSFPFSELLPILGTILRATRVDLPWARSWGRTQFPEGLQKNSFSSDDHTSASPRETSPCSYSGWLSNYR